jgi:hypothetical protein
MSHTRIARGTTGKDSTSGDVLRIQSTSLRIYVKEIMARADPCPSLETYRRARAMLWLHLHLCDNGAALREKRVTSRRSIHTSL